MNTEIESLIFKAYHGEITEQERDLLSQWVIHSPEHARLVVEYAAESRGIEIALRSDQAAQARETIGSMDQVFQNLESDVVAAMVDNTLAARRSHEEKIVAEQFRGLQWRKHSTLAVTAFLSIAALIGIAFWLGGLSPASDRPEQAEFTTPNLVAPRTEQAPRHLDTNPQAIEVFGSELVHFTNVDSNYRNQIGDMPFGFAAYTFEKRGTVVIEGPALWQMLKGDAIRLFEGGLVAMAEEDAYEPLSFLIDSTEIRVQGAEFGVYRTGPDTASFIVFTGSIDISLDSVDEQFSQVTVEAGQTGVLQTRLGTVQQLAPINQDDVTRFSRASVRLRYRPLHTTRSVYYLTDAPRSFYNASLRRREKACLVREAASITVGEAELTSFEKDPANLGAVAEGHTVDSYLLSFDPPGKDDSATTAIEGTITFNRPIQMVLGSSDSIRATDIRYGAPETAYPRSLETAGGDEGTASWGIELDEDDIALSENRKQLIFKLHAGHNLDQLRILVEAR